MQDVICSTRGERVFCHPFLHYWFKLRPAVRGDCSITGDGV